jgi:hypothetical protein
VEPPNINGGLPPRGGYMDRFGYIGQRLDLLIIKGQIRTLPEFDGALEWMRKFGNNDKYLYPPVVHEMLGIPGGITEQVPGTERPALLHRIPATHEIHLHDVEPVLGAARYGEGGFVVHFLGFLLGWRCQFADWWVDGRISLDGHHDYFLVGPPDTVGTCVDLARSHWRSWRLRERTVFLNALYLHNRTACYEWDWERFQAEYQVLDALCAVAKRTWGLRHTAHRDRFAAIADCFGIFRNAGLAKEIVSLRDDLIHSALWGGQTPGTAPEGVFVMPLILHRFNQRLGLAMLGLTSEYVRSNWQSMGQRPFKLDPGVRPAAEGATQRP